MKRYRMMEKIVFVMALLVAGPVLADPPASASGAVTGAVDAPKTTTSANERATTDAAGLGPALPGAHPVPVPGKPVKRHRHHKPR